MSARDELVLDAVAGKRSSRTGWVRGNCPFCEVRHGTPDRKGCLGLELDSGDWHCFRCGARGLVQIDPDLLVESRSRKKKTEPKPKIELPDGFFRLFEEPGLSMWFADAAREYLLRRGIGPSVGRTAGIGAVLAGRYRGRVVAPLFDAKDEQVVGWSARLFVGGDAPKYLYPSGMERQTLLYNGGALSARTEDPIYVVEGVFDALPLWPDAVACLGQPSPGQLDALVSTARPVVCLLDGDAWRKSQALALKLRTRGQRVAWVRLPPKTDPGGSDPAVLRSAAAQALREIA